MIQNPKVSVLVPIYGVEKFIERCAVSLFEQTFQDIEYIFINDCTPDNSINILKNTLERYSNKRSQVKIINHEINKGLAGARNTGVENAKGDYILHVDSDDYIHIDMIKDMYTEAITNNYDMVMCNYLYVWEQCLKEEIQDIGRNKVEFIKSILSGKESTCVWNKLIVRRLYTENNIKLEEGRNFGEDFSVVPQLLYYANSIGKVQKAYYYYYQGNTNAYTKNFSGHNVESLKVVFENLETFFRSKHDYLLYEESILQGMIRKKIEFFVSSKFENWATLYSVFPESKKLKKYDFLNFREKIIYLFIRRRLFLSLFCFLFFLKIMITLKKNI